jgi:CRP/FNR family cyclic AMP-dependent transcriptional regulator
MNHDRTGNSVPAAPETTFWHFLEPADQQYVLHAGTTRRFAAGQLICRQGEPLRHVLVLLAGQVEVDAYSRNGSEAVLGIRNAGEVIGEMSAVDGEPRSATVRTLSNTQVIMIPPERFATLCRQHPEIGWAVLRVVVRRLRQVSAQCAEQTGNTIAERLAALLVELSAEYGAPNGDSVTINLPRTQRELAAMVGGSRESVVRALSDLRSRGIVSTARRTITVLRPDLLRGATSAV